MVINAAQVCDLLAKEAVQPYPTTNEFNSVAAGEQLGNFQLQYKSPFPLILMKISPKPFICRFAASHRIVASPTGDASPQRNHF